MASDIACACGLHEYVKFGWERITDSHGLEIGNIKYSSQHTDRTSTDRRVLFSLGDGHALERQTTAMIYCLDGGRRHAVVCKPGVDVMELFWERDDKLGNLPDNSIWM